MRKRFDAPFQVKSVDEKGHFTGYGSVFGVIDSYKDVVVKGAFADSLDVWRQKGRMPSLLWQHDQTQPIGVYNTVREDKNGLYVEGQLALKTVKGAEAHELMMMDALGGLSIGFITKDESYDHDTNIRELKKIDLYEISLVTFPANEEAKIASVKDALRCGEIPTERELEKYLRDVGFSQKQAKGLIAGGYKSLSQREVGKDDLLESELKGSLEALIKSLTKSI